MVAQRENHEQEIDVSDFVLREGGRLQKAGLQRVRKNKTKKNQT